MCIDTMKLKLTVVHCRSEVFTMVRSLTVAVLCWH